MKTKNRKCVHYHLEKQCKICPECKYCLDCNEKVRECNCDVK